VRQVFFLLISAMFIAFSLSWASPSRTETYRVLPDQVLLPSQVRLTESLELVASVTLNDSCEDIAGVEQEYDGNKVIVSIHVEGQIDHLCRRNSRSDVSVNILIPSGQVGLSQKIDVFFKEDKANLKYFGTIELKPELISRN
jgi:hypothetical protein